MLRIANSSSTPMVSVVMPIRNEAKYIARSLNAVLMQDYPTDRFEVIVADGMSKDGTREIVQSFESQNSNVRLIDNPGKIVPTGLNAAIAQASGDIIARVDGHCEIAPDYLRRCVEHLVNEGVEGVGGPLETMGETSLAQGIAIAMSSPFGVGGSTFRTVVNKTMLADSVAFPAYTRVVVERAGPFDEELIRNQDDEYNYRLRKIGAKILLAADVHCRYYSRSSLRSLWRQYFQYGYWKVRVMQKHPRQMRMRQSVPPLFVATLLGSLSMMPFSVVARWIFALVAGAYGVANLGASIFLARKRGERLFPILPLAFSALHLGWGLGFLVGLIRFWNRWGDHENRSELYQKQGQDGVKV